MTQLAFTTRYGGKVNVLKTEVGVCVPFLGEPTRKEDLKIEKFIAIWDTGATGSVITKKVAKKLKLKPIRITKVHHAGGTSKANVYLVNIALPSNVMIAGVKVTEGILPKEDNAEMLVGMDIISLGDFSVTNFNDKTMLSFRTPSCIETDYVPEADNHNRLEKFKEARKPKNKNNQKKKKKPKKRKKGKKR